MKSSTPLCDHCKLQHYERCPDKFFSGFCSPFHQALPDGIWLMTTTSSFHIADTRSLALTFRFQVDCRRRIDTQYRFLRKRSIGAIVKGYSFTMSVRTRRQKAAAAAVDEQPATAANGVADITSTPKRAEKGPQENIFLFWPNLVGKPRNPYTSFFSTCVILEC